MAVPSMHFWDKRDFTNIAKGPVGPTGYRGPFGIRGATGLTGDIGPTGVTGPRGRPGAVGVGANGPQAPLSKYVNAETGTMLLVYPAVSSESARIRIYSTGADAFASDSIIVRATPADGVGIYRITGSLYIECSYPQGWTSPLLIPIDFYGDLNSTHNLTSELRYKDYAAQTTTYRMVVRFSGRSIEIYNTYNYYTIATSTPTEFSPARTYMSGSSDSSPVSGDTDRMVSSGGVADAYIALIEKLGQNTSLTAAQVAAMKALYGG